LFDHARSREWPIGVPLQIHTREDDEWGDADVARGLAEGAELFLRF
jgi:hypothetical protein